MQALRESHKAFIQSEADEHIRRALRHKIRAGKQFFNPNDCVFYKREGHNKWLGPAKVIFQDGQVVFVRHGGIFVQVSPNRLIHVDEQFIKNPENDQNNYHETASTEPCVNESPAQTKSTVQETLGKVNSNKNDNNESLSHPSEVTLTTPPPPPPPSVIHIDNSTQETTNIPLEPVSTNQPQLTFPEKNDTISIMCDDKTWSNAKVLGWGGKSTGKHKNCINV